MLDYEALDKASEDLEERAAGGSKNIVSIQKMDSGTSIFIRILPPTESLKGFFYFEERGHWISGERYVSPVTFGGKPVIEDIVEKAKATKDPEILSLLDSREYNQKSYFYIPILLCELHFKQKSITKVTVVDDEPKILQANSTVVRRLLKLFQSRLAQNGTPDRLADREKGMFIEITKTGKKLNTEYNADIVPEEWEMDEKYYEEIPDVFEFVKEKMKPVSELKAAINAYLFGEEDEDAKPKKKKAASRDEDEEDEKPAKKKKSYEDEDDEDERPAKKKKSARDFLADSE